jgi:2-amino-4-hydroxy-6-hydroxymethyldihydropteridine diphosphokinase
MKKSIISLGSSLGNRKHFIKRAKKHISNLAKTNILKKSNIMKTSPIGSVAKNFFINQIILIETDIMPEDLIIYFKQIEEKLGRKKNEKWSDREIDIDIISYEGVMIKDKNLKIPHPETLNRLFVLEGAKQVAPNYILEGVNMDFNSLYDVYKEKFKNQEIEVIN